MDDDKKVLVGAGEVMKERHRRLLVEARESLRQKKPRTLKQREALLAERFNGRVEEVPRQRERMIVDRRWEFEVLSKMREKAPFKVEKEVKATMKRVEWGITYVPKLTDYIIRLYAS